jgi:hypothetical protein
MLDSNRDRCTREIDELYDTSDLSDVRQRRRMLKNTNRVLRGNDPNPDRCLFWRFQISTHPLRRDDLGERWLLLTVGNEALGLQSGFH